MPTRVDDANVFQGEGINNIGQRSPRSMPIRVDDANVFQGKVIDNDGQQSPRSMPTKIDDANVFRGEVIDNVGQRSPRSLQTRVDDMSVFRGEVIDNVGQRFPRSLQTRADNVNLFRGEVIDNVGQQSPFNKTKPRLPEPGAGTNSINLSQSVTQILASMGKDGYINPRERLAVISVYTDTWKETMTARFNNQEERLLGLENQLFLSRNAVERYKNSFTGFRNEVLRLHDMIARHERTIPKLKREVETSLGKVNSVLTQVEDRMDEFLIWINHIKESNLNEKIPVDIVNSLHKIIQDSSAASSVESMRLQVEEMS